jgi:hypothetical protein
MRTYKQKLNKTITTNKSTDVPDRAWEEDKLSPCLHFPLLWRNICTYFKNKKNYLFKSIFHDNDYYLITIVSG